MVIQFVNLDDIGGLVVFELGNHVDLGVDGVVFLR